MAVALNTNPSSILKKKNQICSCHKVREAISAGFTVHGHVRSEDNVADTCINTQLMLGLLARGMKRERRES